MSKIIDNKLDEVIALCRVEKDMPTLSILLALRGARTLEMQVPLMNNVAKFVEQTLVPHAQQGKQDSEAIKN